MLEYITNYINNKKLKDFTIQVGKSLDIEKLVGDIKINDYPNKANSFAFTDLNKDKPDIYLNPYKIEKLVYDITHPRSNNNIKKLLACKIIQYLIVHELAHILQRERGELEEIKKLVKLSPEEQLNHKIEIEADDIAYHYMSQQNDVSKAIAKYLIGLRRNKFDNFDSTELLLMKGDINKLLNKNVFNDC